MKISTAYFDLKYLLILIISLTYSCKPQSTTEETLSVSNEPATLLTMGQENSGKHIVLVSGDEEYRSEEALPQLAKILSTHHNFKCTVLFAQDPEATGIVNPNYTRNIPGLEHLDQADLMVVFTRFRALPDEQMQHFEKYLLAGKPVVGIRTATHAFHFKDTTNQWAYWGNYHNKEGDPWDGGFGRLVLGEHWYTHHGHHKHQSTRGLIAEGAENHPVLNGIPNGEIWGPTDVYGVRLPLPGDTQHLVMGQVINREGAYDENDPFFGMRPSDSEVADRNPATDEAYNPNDPMMPIAWIRTYQLPDGNSGKAFTSTIGSSTDLTNEAVRRLLVNATYFLLDMRVPESATVDLVGAYSPSPYSFHEDQYWDQKQLKVTDLQ